MNNNIELLQYADADILLHFIQHVIENKEKFLVNYQIDLLKLDDILLHKLLFDYKIMAFREENNERFVIFKVPELEETEAVVTLWIASIEDTELLENAVNKIKEEYSFYGWKYINIVVLRKQLTSPVKNFIQKYSDGSSIMLHGNQEENDRFFYRISIE